MPSLTPILPRQQTAIVAEAAGKLHIQHDAMVPSPGTMMPIVKSAAVAINPVDAKMLGYSPVPGAVHGYDFAGTIVAIGPNAPAHRQIEDRVTGWVYDMNSVQPDVGGCLC